MHRDCCVCWFNASAIENLIVRAFQNSLLQDWIVLIALKWQRCCCLCFVVTALVLFEFSIDAWAFSHTWSHTFSCSVKRPSRIVEAILASNPWANIYFPSLSFFNTLHQIDICLSGISQAANIVLLLFCNCSGSAWSGIHVNSIKRFGMWEIATSADRQACWRIFQ